MTRYLARRLLNYLVLLALASFLTYCLTSLAFSPLESLMQRSPRPPQAVIDAKAHDLGLDRPILARYANWVSHAVRGDFGTTITGQPVGTELGRRIGVSLRLLVVGSVFGTVAGVVIGAWGAIRQYRLSDRVMTTLALLVLSTPTFVVANLLILGALRVNWAVGIQLFDYTGRRHRRCRRGVGSARRPVAAFDPAIADVGAGGRRRVQPLPAQRDAGCPRPGFHSHRPRQGADPTTGPTQAWPANGANTDGHAVRLQGGRVGHRSGFVEKIFGWHGMGEWMVRGISTQDTNIVAAITVFSGAVVLLAGLLSDVIYAALDPRVRVS